MLQVLATLPEPRWPVSQELERNRWWQWFLRGLLPPCEKTPSMVGHCQGTAMQVWCIGYKISTAVRLKAVLDYFWQGCTLEGSQWSEPNTWLLLTSLKFAFKKCKSNCKWFQRPGSRMWNHFGNEHLQLCPACCLATSSGLEYKCFVLPLVCLLKKISSWFWTLWASGVPQLSSSK